MLIVSSSSLITIGEYSASRYLEVTVPNSNNERIKANTIQSASHPLPRLALEFAQIAFTYK